MEPDRRYSSSLSVIHHIRPNTTCESKTKTILLRLTDQIFHLSLIRNEIYRPEGLTAIHNDFFHVDPRMIV
jgi:hypothetical protein